MCQGPLQQCAGKDERHAELVDEGKGKRKPIVVGLLLRKNKSCARVWWLSYSGMNGCERYCQQKGTSATGAHKTPPVHEGDQKRKELPRQ